MAKTGRVRCIDCGLVMVKNPHGKPRNDQAVGIGNHCDACKAQRKRESRERRVGG